ncbi:MAG: GntR family transcriptional regulator [Pseudomonas sp.]
MSKDARYHAKKLRDSLEDDIVNGRLKPGERLDEASLTERFQVSRTPVREALQQLAATGLVQIISKRGTYVAELSLPQLIEMFEVMGELESMCARLCARRISTGERVELLEALEACRQAAARGDSDTYYYENERFHNIIYQGSHNSFLVQQTRLLHARLKPYRRLQLRVSNRMQRSLAEHETVAEAIIAGDGQRAADCLRDHVVIQGERFSDFVSSVGAAFSTCEVKSA